MTTTLPRFSRLPVLQFCGQAQVLGEQGASSRAAAIGTAFHARCHAIHHPEAKPEADAHYTRLTDDERKMVDALIPPTAITVNGFDLEYETATKEHKCSLSFEGEVIVEGTADLFWIHENVAYVADIKRTSFTAPDGPASLQVIGYARAIHDEFGCDGYYPAIWDATSGEWQWGDYVDAWSAEADDHLGRIVAAARNHGGEYAVGGHCSGCYARQRCPAYLLPLELACTSLAPFTEPGAITNENALEALMNAKRAIDTAETVKELVEQFARDNDGVVDAERGKVWKPCTVKGRTSFDAKRLEADHPELAQQYTKFGSSFEQFKWVNVPKPPKAPKVKS